MSTRHLTGSAVALVTPFHADLTVDHEALRRLVEFHVEAGTDIVIPCGTTGESPCLTEAEEAEIIRTVRDASKGRVMVGSGAGSNSTVEAVRMARSAEEAGAETILSVAPYYNKPSQEGLYQHYRRVAEAVSIPIILYNVPGRTGCNIEAKTVLRLAREFENIAAVKEATDNMAQIAELLDGRPENFSILTGEDPLILPFMAMGGDGVISVAANQIPREIKRLVESTREGRLDEARELNRRYRRLLRLNFIESNPVPVKYALARMGMIEEHYRLPLVPLTEASKAEMDRELKSLGLV
ncbi:4-hydroxy-tetrahydrodipicolinate synthase [Chlorobium sp. N1]|uniref:4-hydroxy-tetrahydrodipicolinate synthase n=1 Tax=Chlorobium sp. N1 TaxID=2491138 RepID=UPI00103D2DB3|nr:4-hydroxy-tetrahydrodipicolinate synthase [Chlorobium sp. N1]TCD48741.1 4-hydroxy-tetrahydrodipicolinate synthase [Chlorobium sp. N1]